MKRIAPISKAKESDHSCKQPYCSEWFTFAERWCLERSIPEIIVPRIGVGIRHVTLTWVMFCLTGPVHAVETKWSRRGKKPGECNLVFSLSSHCNLSDSICPAESCHRWRIDLRCFALFIIESWEAVWWNTLRVCASYDAEEGRRVLSSSRSLMENSFCVQRTVLAEDRNTPYETIHYQRNECMKNNENRCTLQVY